MIASPRFYCPLPLQAGISLDLPANAARHVQVLRMQPGQSVVLFGQDGGEWLATIETMGRSQVTVCPTQFFAISRETTQRVHLVVALVANERMDYLLEKGTELGAAGFLPLETERCVMRLSGDRALKRRDHWQAIVNAACEQSGRNTVPQVAPIQTLQHYLVSMAKHADGHHTRYLLSLADSAPPLSQVAQHGTQTTPHSAHSAHSDTYLVSGPEGGWTPDEEARLVQSGHIGVSLGNRVLRADTAPLAALAALTLRS